MSSETIPGDAVRNSDTVQDELKRLHDTDGLSFRQIATLSPWQGIPAGTLCSVYKGDVRMPNEYCAQVGMHPLVKVRADMVKTAPRGARKRYPPRIAIRKDDAASAVRSMRNNIAPDVLSEIVKGLSEMEY